MNRRTFLTTTASGVLAMTTAPAHAAAASLTPKKITIAETSCDFEREPLIRPFGFKGGYLTNIWQSAALLRSAGGQHGIGICTHSTLWSDASVFLANSEAAGNALMFALTAYALQRARNVTFQTPVDLLERLLPDVYAYGQKITNNPKLRKTFALNALVGVDNAAWILYARENQLTSFDQMIPAAYKPALSAHHNKVAAIPLMAYGIPIPEIKSAVESGYFFMKIKIGQPGTQEEMLQKDMARISAIHAVLKECRTPHTSTGKLPYYFDANGRYEKKETLLRLIDHLDKIGALEQVALIEEPFDEYAPIDVHDIPVRLAADESAHTVADALERIEMGYRAMALKPIAKTMSMTMQIAQAAHTRTIPCFCADLTVCPILVEWNKCVAARLAAFPGLNGLGLLETNGHQNYRNWETMRTYLAHPNAAWSTPRAGVFELPADYYAASGGILDPLPHYENFFKKH